MPRYLKWTGLAAAVLLIVSGFMPWLFIESKDLTFTGVDTTGSNFGKPAYIHFVFTAIFILLTLIPRLWAKRVNLLVVALNIAWALRNFFMVAACQGGECPVKKTGIWFMLLSSILMLVSALFPDMKIPEKKEDE